MGNRGTKWGEWWECEWEWDGNAGNQGGDAGNQGGTAGYQGGNGEIHGGSERNQRENLGIGGIEELQLWRAIKIKGCVRL